MAKIGKPGESGSGNRGLRFHRYHRDRFDFWRWSRQALGAPGLLLGWSPWLRAKVRRTAAANLARFTAQQNA